jgi:NAD(P)-dependent dehydrogenase (short-subunit alcohol dehydrogenase family)
MARVFITGSSDGLGRMAARLLISEGHQVVVHGRNSLRAEEAMKSLPGAETAVMGDLSSMEETRKLADEVNRLGRFDAIIHNAAVGSAEKYRVNTVDGLPHVFAINSLAPYILTCLIRKPDRLVYMTSGLHRNGDADLSDITWEKKSWNGFAAYSDSKLHNLMLAFTVARKWDHILSNGVEPGWVPTKMGGPGAPDSLEDGAVTQVWLAVSNDRNALVSGQCFFHKKLQKFHPSATDTELQEKLLKHYERLSGVRFPVR